LAQVYADSPEWTRWLESVAWLNANTPPSAVILARKPDMLYLLSGHPTVEYPYSQDGNVLLSTLETNGVTFILEDSFTWTKTTEIYLAPAMLSRSAAFHLAFETAAPTTRVWAVQP
jgi:hypothetical protein